MIKASSKPTSYVLSTKFQKVFIGLAVASVVVQVLITAYYAAQQYPHNQNFSAFLPVFAMSIIMPLLFFLIPFVLAIRRKRSLLGRFFEASLLAVVGGLAFFTITSLVFFLQGLVAVGLESYDDYMLFTYVPMFVALLLYALTAAYYLRRRT